MAFGVQGDRILASPWPAVRQTGRPGWRVEECARCKPAGDGTCGDSSPAARTCALGGDEVAAGTCARRDRRRCEVRTAPRARAPSNGPRSGCLLRAGRLPLALLLPDLEGL